MIVTWWPLCCCALSELSTVDYCLLGVDLTQLNTLEAALRLCGADFDTPTLLLSECVMTYMTRRWCVTLSCDVFVCRNQLYNN